MTTRQPQAITRLEAPEDLIIAILRQNSEARTFDKLTDLLPSASYSPAQETRILRHLTYLDIVIPFGKRYQTVAWPRKAIGEHLAVAGALSTLAAYQVALEAPPHAYDTLTALNAEIRQMDHTNPENLLEGAYLDYQFHLECIRISRNAATLEAYKLIAPPALWLTAANYFDIQEALSSLTQHDNLVHFMKTGDAIRARDAAQYHFEDAMMQIAKAASSNIESYPASRAKSRPRAKAR